MKAEKLHVINCISNLARWKSRIALYQAFEKHMLEAGVQLTVVECQYGERPFEIETSPGVNHIKVRARTPLWTKENLINIGVHRLPHDWKYMAWIDADITFRRKDWAAETIHALQQYHIVQPWSDCYDLGPNDEHLAHHQSFCKLHHHDTPMRASSAPYQPYGHTGYAWACTRQAYEWLGGLLETAVGGSGDHHMGWALLGKAQQTLPAGIHANYADLIYAWQDRAVNHIAGNISYIPGTIEHSWHGPKEKRQYISRWDIIAKNALDPNRDIKKNAYGVYELTGNKPDLMHQIDRYFRTREEDSNSLG